MRWEHKSIEHRNLPIQQSRLSGWLHGERALEAMRPLLQRTESAPYSTEHFAWSMKAELSYREHLPLRTQANLGNDVHDVA